LFTSGSEIPLSGAIDAVMKRGKEGMAKNKI
jgi:hypothetical protein